MKFRFDPLIFKQALNGKKGYKINNFFKKTIWHILGIQAIRTLSQLGSCSGLAEGESSQAWDLYIIKRISNAHYLFIIFDN